MRDYSKVSGQFWTGKTGKLLRGDPEAQLLALYLMTSPHANMIGVFHCPILYMAHETGMPIEGATKGLTRLIEADFCTYNEEDEVVWVHEMSAHQVGERLSLKDKQCLGVQRQYDCIAQTQIQQGFYARYASDYHLKKRDEKPQENTSPFQAPSKPLRSQEQEQEQEQEVNPRLSPRVSESQKSAIPDKSPGEGEKIDPVPLCPQKEILDLYAQHLPMLIQPRVWDGAREQLLRNRWRTLSKPNGVTKGYVTQSEGLAFFEKFFGYVAKSPTLTNGIPRKEGGGVWQPDLPWLLKAENFAKVVEGKYHDEGNA